MNTGEHAPFDAALRARHAEALDQLSPRVRAQLAQRRHAALRDQAHPRARRNGLRYAIAGFAAIGALALGLQLQRPPSLDPPTTPATVARTAPTAAPRGDTLLDQDPEFYAWLASPDAQQLAME